MNTTTVNPHEFLESLCSTQCKNCRDGVELALNDVSDQFPDAELTVEFWQHKVGMGPNGRVPIWEDCKAHALRKRAQEEFGIVHV